MQNHIINIDNSIMNINEQKNKIILPIKYKNVINLKISSIEFPNTSYTFSKNKDNNSFTVILNNKEYLIKIEDGNYDENTLKDLIDSQLKKIDANLEISFKKNQYKYLIYHKEKKKFMINFYKKNLNEYSLGKFLGFIEYLYYDNYIYQGENIVNLKGDSYVFLYLNGLGNIVHNNIRYLSKIIITKQKFDINYDGSHKFVSKEVIFEKPIDIAEIYFRIDDCCGNKLNLNGFPLSFTLELTSINNSLLQKYKNLTFYNPQLMKLVLDDVMLDYFINQSKNYKMGKEYDNILNKNVVTHYTEDYFIDKTVNNINETINYEEDLKKTEERDKKIKKNKIIKKILKSLQKKDPKKFNEIKDDKKKISDFISQYLLKKKIRY